MLTAMGPPYLFYGRGFGGTRANSNLNKKVAYTTILLLESVPAIIDIFDISSSNITQS